MTLQQSLSTLPVFSRPSWAGKVHSYPLFNTCIVSVYLFFFLSLWPWWYQGRNTAVSQGINKSANFCFLWRLSIIFGFRRDLLLPAKTTVHEKWLPAETVCMILLPAHTYRNTDSLCRKPFTKYNSLGRKQEITEAKYDGQSLQEAKISWLVYTLWGLEVFFETGVRDGFLKWCWLTQIEKDES